MRTIIQETIEKVNLPSKQFTQQLRKLEKECGGTYWLKLDDEERNAMYTIIDNTIKDDFQNNETQYNIFRLAKYVVRVPKYFKENFENYLKRFLRTVFHPYGNIRVVGRKLVDHIRFGIYDLVDTGKYSKISKEKAEENKKKFYPMIANLFMNLQAMEADYQLEHISSIDPRDAYIGREFINPEDTQDKILKSIRKGMEARDVGSMDKIMEYCGYLPLYKANKPWFCGGRYLPKEMINANFIDEDGITDEASDEFMNAETQKIVQQKRKETEKALKIFISSNNLKFDAQYIKDMIYYSDENLMVGDKKYMQFWMDICDEHNIDISQNLLDLFTFCRNYFPHKILDGKCPEEKINGL